MSATTLSLYDRQQQYIEERLGREDYKDIDEVYDDADRIFTPTRELKIQAIRDSWEQDDADYEAGIYFTAEEVTAEIIAAEAKAWRAELRAKYGPQQVGA